MQKSQQDMATCPFNKAHKFARQKYVFHINRCKDKEKVIDKFSKCQYNPLHYFLKEQIQMHECCCPSRQETIETVSKLQQTYRRSIREPRQRSREREIRGQTKLEQEQTIKNEFIEDQDTLQTCKQCSYIMKIHQQSIKESNNQRLKSYLLKYHNLDAQ